MPCDSLSRTSTIMINTQHDSRPIADGPYIILGIFQMFVAFYYCNFVFVIFFIYSYYDVLSTRVKSHKTFQLLVGLLLNNQTLSELVEFKLA